MCHDLIADTIHHESIPYGILHHPCCVLHHWALRRSKGWSDDLHTGCSTWCLSTESFGAGACTIPIFIFYPYIACISILSLPIVFKVHVHGHMSNKWRAIATEENI